MVEKILIYERDAFFALNGSDSAFLDRFMDFHRKGSLAAVSLSDPVGSDL